jgi:hypothetical protein
VTQASGGERFSDSSLDRRASPHVQDWSYLGRWGPSIMWRVPSHGRGNAKPPARKSQVERVWSDAQWTVERGRLVRAPGRPRKQTHLFTVVGEKLPIESLSAVHKELKSSGLGEEGVYVAHDSMGYARYVGRGRIFTRLRSRWKQSELEIKYFSFYVVKQKVHEREVETLLIRAAAPMLYFNERKKRLDLSAGNVRDYEPGTEFFERQYKRGRRKQGRA